MQLQSVLEYVIPVAAAIIIVGFVAVAGIITDDVHMLVGILMMFTCLNSSSSNTSGMFLLEKWLGEGTVGGLGLEDLRELDCSYSKASR